MTECNQAVFAFDVGGGRSGVASFDGGAISSDGGLLLLQRAERATGIIRRLAGCFTDHRDPELIEHSVGQLVAQRVYALALGHEDLNDHDTLRHDPLLAAVVGKSDPLGRDRLRAADRGKALAGKSTLNRLELTAAHAGAGERYKKIVAHKRLIEDLLVDLFLDAHPVAPEEIVLDLDATDDPIHGRQQGRFYHGYYDSYCYLPLYIFCGPFPLCARLRPSCIDASAGALKQVQRILRRVRQRWPKTRVILRGDSGFCRENTMSWCEAHGVYYLFGLAKNARLVGMIGAELEQAKTLSQESGRPARVFQELAYQTLHSWSRSRRVVAKAEHLRDEPNPRFVVTNLGLEYATAGPLYEDVYCQRGDMENRIKEQQLGLFADRTSACTLRANQLRLWLSTTAYSLMLAVRRLGLEGTTLAQAQCTTLRTALLKIGALVRVTCRKVWVHLSQSHPMQQVFAQAWCNLTAAGSLPITSSA
jgi:hypothetical protein